MKDFRVFWTLFKARQQMVDGKSTTKIMRMAREEQQELFGSGKSDNFKMDLTNDDEFPSLGGAPAEEFDEEDEQFEDFDGNEGNFGIFSAIFSLFWYFEAIFGHFLAIF